MRYLCKHCCQQPTDVDFAKVRFQRHIEAQAAFVASMIRPREQRAYLPIRLCSSIGPFARPSTKREAGCDLLGRLDLFSLSAHKQPKHAGAPRNGRGNELPTTAIRGSKQSACGCQRNTRRRVAERFTQVYALHIHETLTKQDLELKRQLTRLTFHKLKRILREDATSSRI